MKEVSPREEIVLYALYNKELYGLQIKKAIEESSQNTRSIGIGSLYLILHSLEKKKLVESWWGEERREDRGGARRKYYKLTNDSTKLVDQIILF